MVHATASSYDGPYSFSDVVTAPFAHEPNAVRSPEGDWVVFMTMRHPAGGAANCTPATSGSEQLAAKPSSASPSRALLPEPRHTYMTHSPGPGGPWAEPVLVLKANYSIWCAYMIIVLTSLSCRYSCTGGTVVC